MGGGTRGVAVVVIELGGARGEGETTGAGGETTGGIGAEGTEGAGARG